ncbi:MAG: sel1 repeat family protein [Alphaproteobacteria bacterium]|nr:sel1 repeat family protein [Alphaproteobacteria bacterium]
MRTVALAIGLAFAAGSAAAQEQGQMLGDLPEAPKETAPPTPGDQQMFNQGTAYYDRGDYMHAYQVFYWLAEHDDVAAMRNVALMKRRGQGTALDPQGAMEYLKEAADAGLPTAEADLGEMYLYGEAGPPDPQSALPWLEAAAAAHHPTAQFLLAEIYERGQAVPRDVQKAEKLYAEAAARGVPHAADRLALLKSGAVSAPRP